MVFDIAMMTSLRKRMDFNIAIYYIRRRIWLATVCLYIRRRLWLATYMGLTSLYIRRFLEAQRKASRVRGYWRFAREKKYSSTRVARLRRTRGNRWLSAITSADEAT